MVADHCPKLKKLFHHGARVFGSVLGLRQI